MITDRNIHDELEHLAQRVQSLEHDNDELKERIADLELQTGQLTERLLKNGSCSSCGI